MPPKTARFRADQKHVQACFGRRRFGGMYASANRSKSTGGGTFTYGGVGSPNKFQAAKTAGKDVSAFREGVKVSHPKFGTGTIVKVAGIQGNTVLHVAFEGFGIKQLSAALAPLKIIG